MSVEGADGASWSHRVVVPTAADTWATTQAPNLFDDLYTGEVWDGRVARRLEASGFWADGTVPAGLETAAVLRDNGGVNHSVTMSAQLMPPIEIRASYKPVSVTKVDSFLDTGDAHCLPGVQCVPGVGHNNSAPTSGWVFTFKQSVAGVATLRVKRSDFKGPTRCQWRNNSAPNATVSSVLAPYGCVVLRYGNLLENDNTVMNQFGAITYDQSDVFILGPQEEEQVYQVHFSYHGLTHIWLSGLPSDATPPPLSMLTAHKTNTAVEDTGAVSTDHKVLNWIVHAARMSVTDVLQSIGMDVPDRERLGWLGDVSQYSEAAMRMLDMPAFFQNQLRNEADQAAISGGWLTAIAPCPFHWGQGDPAWVSALPGIAQHLYNETADLEIFRRVYHAVKTQVELYIHKSDSSRSKLLEVGGFGDYINLACTWAIYGGSTKAGVLNDTGIRCNPYVGDDYYFLRALNGVVQMAKVLNDTSTHAAMSKVERQKREVFSRYYTGSNATTDSHLQDTNTVSDPPPLPHEHRWVSFELQSEPLFIRTSCLHGFGSTLPQDSADRGDATYDLQPGLNSVAGSISLAVWEQQGGLPCKYGAECPYYVTAQPNGKIAVTKDDGTVSFRQSASFTFNSTTGELKTLTGALVHIADALTNACKGSDGKSAGVGDLIVTSGVDASPKRSKWKQVLPLLNSTPVWPGPSPSPAAGSLSSLTTTYETQSLLSLVATSNALSPQMERLSVVAMLNDLMSTDENCILTSGAHPDGIQYGCFVQRAHFTGTSPLILAIIPSFTELIVNRVKFVAGGMEGFKATVEALEAHERVDELYETLTTTTWPGFGFMMARGSSGVLWESWSVAPPLNAGICKFDQACTTSSAVQAVAYYVPRYLSYPGSTEVAASFDIPVVVIITHPEQVFRRVGSVVWPSTISPSLLASCRPPTASVMPIHV
eukprot:COSAG01_NODE_5034_length_4534_cov_1.968433_3_plen_935_part_00